MLCGLFTTTIIALPGCRKDDNGPGMVVTYSAMLEGLSVNIVAIQLPDGSKSTGPGSFGGTRRNGWRNGATMGMAGDRRDLPEWVEFEWQEFEYPGITYKPKDMSNEAYGIAVRKLYDTTPHKTQRIPVRSRVPHDVVEEVIFANTHLPPGATLPTKMLWVYFVWTAQGVKFRWSLHDRSIRPELEREGGDDPAEF